MSKVIIPIFVESRYKLDRKRVKKAVLDVIAKQEITGPVEVSVAIVGDRKMRELSKIYKNEDKTRNVLSFSQDARAGDTLLLGDIVISYPEVIREAARDEVLVDEKVEELVKHGLQHLLGLHHE